MKPKFLDWEFWEIATLEDVKDEIARGANVNAQSKNGWTVLMRAIYWRKSIDIIKTLLDAGADVNAKTKSGRTALYYAKNKTYLKNNKTIMRLLEGES